MTSTSTTTRSPSACPTRRSSCCANESPVHWYDWEHGKGFWCITRYDDIVTVLKDWRTFSSETGATALEDLDPDQIEARKSMLDTDPPEHSSLRAIVNKGFTPRAVAAYEDLLRAADAADPGRRAAQGRVRLRRGGGRAAADPGAVPDPRRAALGRRPADRLGRQDDRQHRPRAGRAAPGQPGERQVPPVSVPQPGRDGGLPLRARDRRRATRASRATTSSRSSSPGRTRTAGG